LSTNHLPLPGFLQQEESGTLILDWLDLKEGEITAARFPLEWVHQAEDSGWMRARGTRVQLDLDFGFRGSGWFGFYLGTSSTTGVWSWAAIELEV